MNNRNWYNRPTQGNGRNVYNYGNTELNREPKPIWQGPMWLYALAGIAFALAVAVSA